VGGYVTEVLGHLPSIGEETVIEGFNARVTDADEKSVKEIRFTRLPVEDDEEDKDGDSDQS
jgi:Mg2+/Co2+ transporter CorC